MKKLLALGMLLIAINSFPQTDQHGNPVFNSVSTNEETIKDFQFTSNYYTLKTNIENKNSSVYISENPSLGEIENAAINLPSEFFINTKNQSMINLIMLFHIKKLEKQF